MTVPHTDENGSPAISVVAVKGDGTADPPIVAVSSIPAATTGAETNVAGSAGSGTLLAANANRKGAVIANDSSAILYVLLAAGPASAAKYSYQMAGSTSTGIAHLEVPAGYTGIITGIWASATGSARVTELI